MVESVRWIWSVIKWKVGFEQSEMRVNCLMECSGMCKIRKCWFHGMYFLLSNFLLLVLFMHLISLFWVHVPYSEYMRLYVPKIFVNYYSRVQQLYYLFLHVLCLWWLNAYLHGCSSKVLSQLHSAFYEISKYEHEQCTNLTKGVPCSCSFRVLTYPSNLT